VVMGHENMNMGLWDLNIEVGRGYGTQEHGCGTWVWRWDMVMGQRNMGVGL